jgi:LacI family transcriptional regulator
MPHLTNVRRLDEFLHSMKKVGLTGERAPVFIGEHTFEGGTQASLHFLSLEPRPTAVVCSNDMMAVGVLRVLTERGIKVPHDISVVGFDDIHMAEFMNPPLTTVRMSRQDLARAAFKGLEVLWAEESPDPPGPIRVDTHLVVRQSTDSPRQAVEGLPR